jgi:hypothetical protein
MQACCGDSEKTLTSEDSRNARTFFFKIQEKIGRVSSLLVKLAL